MSLHIAFEQSAQHIDRLRTAAPERPGQISLLCDDAVAATAWRRALQAEGIASDDHDDSGTADAIVLLVHGGLPAQLGRVRELRNDAPGVPLVVACSGLRELDQILALELGADDVIDTSLSAPVVAARLRALWRRKALWQSLSGRDTPRPRRLQFGALVLALDQRRVTLHGTVVDLTEGEFEVLWLLAAQAGQTLTRHEMLKRVRGLDDHPQDRSIDSRIYRIRAKLGDNDRDGRVDQPRIRTVRNRGYVFSPGDW
jgi:DNA-binding response OmpR family regulator